MAFYKSKFTGQEIDARLTQGTYDDAVKAGFKGTKEEFYALLGQLQETTDAATISQPAESDKLETFNKNIVDAINELHQELQAKPDEKDVIDQEKLEVFKDEIDAKYATKEEVFKKLDSDKLISGAGIDISEEDNKKIINISNDALTKIQYSDSEVRRLENDKISYAYDEKTQSNINVILPEGGSYLGNYGDENATITKAAVYDGIKQLEIGSPKIHTNINTDSNITIETSTGKKTIATIDELVNVVNIPIRNLQDKVYTQEEILDWFNSTDVIDLKNKIVRGSLMYLKFGISLSGNPMYYKMPIEYVAFESANQIKLVFVGLNTRDDVTSKYEIIINLDGTIIEGSSNIKLTLLSLESDLSQYALKSDIPTQYIVEEGAALQAGNEQHEFNIKSGGRVTINSNNEVVTYTPYPGETGRKMLVLANNDSLTGTKTDGTGSPLIFMSKWDKIEVGGSSTPLNLNSSTGEITINDSKTIATTDLIEALEQRVAALEAQLNS